MRFPILAIAAAIAAIASPAVAQDRTLPAGAYQSMQPQVDPVDVRQAPTVEGRSVRETPVRNTHMRADHRS